MSQSAWTSTGLPIRGVTTQSPTFASIQVSWTPGTPAASRPSPVARMPNRVPRAYPSRIAATALRRASSSGRGSLRRRERIAPRRSWTATTYQSEASTELYSGTEAPSGKRFGSIPSETAEAHSTRIRRASSSRPEAMQRPRIEMNVSRPQSVNQG